jgi:hypothetical protein
MATIQCTRCKTYFDDSTASFGETGLICDPCARGEIARDAAQMHQAVQAAARGPAFMQSGVLGSAMNAMSGNFTFTQSDTARDATGPIAADPTVSAPAYRSQTHIALEQRGATVQSTNLSSSFSVGPLTRSRIGLREIWTLPSAPSVQATFGSESFFTMVKKIFKREIQTGDESFDSAVYIQTSTPEATQAWLASPEVRSALTAIVKSGETFSIEGNVVTGSIYWEVGEVGSPEVIAQLVASLI